MNRVRPTLAACIAALLLTLVPLAGAHVWNFENRGELCGVAPGQYSPHGHTDTDGHAHWHHTAPSADAHDHWDPATQGPKTYPAGHDHEWFHTAAAATGHNHFNAKTWAFEWHPAGHTHASPMHDPCLQTRMDYPQYLASADVPLNEVDPPLTPLDPLATLYAAPDANRSRVYAGGEAYEFPVKVNQWKRVSSLVVSSDLQAAGMGFPGDGSRANPYVVSGYIVTGNLIIKNTSKCFVVKDNVVVNRVIPGKVILDLPEIPLWEVYNWTRARINDTLETTDDTVNGTLAAIQQVLNGNVLVSLDAFLPAYQDATLLAQGMRNDVDAQKLVEDAAQAVRDQERAAWDADKAAQDAERAQWQADAAAWEAAWDQYASDYFVVLVETERLADDFQSYSSQYGAPTQPAKAHQPYVDYVNEVVTDLDAIDEVFVPYQQDDAVPSNDNVQGWIEGNPPPSNPPPGWSGTPQSWQYEVQNYPAFQDGIAALIAAYYDYAEAAPDQGLYDQFLADKAEFDASYAAFVAAYDAFLADYVEDTAAYEAFLRHHQAIYTFTGGVFAEANAFATKAGQFDFQYKGVRGLKLFNTLDELFVWAIKLALGILNGLDINEPARNTGQLTLDWNGQCMHAYNNVAFDLRVNQNNDRTGYATGGIIEQNRFYTIGQIRHYDGIFRNNEVGNRAFLHQLVNPSVAPLAISARAINNDGANQGWYYGNVIYGNVDLDFHGHHHSPGFFAPQSHYHGSTATVAYMRNAAGCTHTQANIPAQTAHGPHKDHPSDNDNHAFHNVVVARPDPVTCLPHFDHGKRWTSVFFNDNLVIDPNGVGLRFEDRDHRADDEQANSENMRELKKPHYHQKWVQMERNTVVGKMFVDVLNAAGTDLWNDDWSAVRNRAGPARSQEAVNHPGARIVNSHQYRNDAWLDIKDNTILATQSAAVLVADAEDMTLMQLKGNDVFGFPKNYQTTKTPAEFLAWLKGLSALDADTAWTQVQALKGQDRGVQTFAQLVYLRDAFRVEHCGNEVRGMDYGLVATDRIYDDGNSIIQACAATTYPANIVYTPAPAQPVRCTEDLREFTDGTDSLYLHDYTFDVMDGVTPASVCTLLAPPVAPPGPGAVGDPVAYTAGAVSSLASYVMGLI